MYGLWGERLENSPTKRDLGVQVGGTLNLSWQCALAARKGLHQRVVGMEQTAQGSEHGPDMLQLRECWGTAFGHRVSVWVVHCGVRGWT